MRILLATDGSECSQAAAVELARRPLPPGSTVKVLSAVDLTSQIAPTMAGMPAGYDVLVRALSEAADEAVRRATEAFGSRARRDLDVVGKVVIAPAAAAILDEAAAWPADLVVVGSHGKGALKRFLLGSVSHAVLAGAPCSVEIVRAPTCVEAV